MSTIREQMELEKQRRNRALANLIKEAVINTIAEQQAPLAADPMSAAQPAPPQAQTPPPPATPDQNSQQPGVQSEQFTLDKMIEKLNVIRGGRSFTDPEIYGQLTTLFKSWDDATKQTVEKTFDELAKVVTLNGPEDQSQQNPMDQQQPPPPQPAGPPTTPVNPGAMPQGGGMPV